MRFRSMMLACVGLLAAAPLVAQQSQPSTASMDSLRNDLKAGKRQIVAAAMVLTTQEDATFWPVYDAFQADLQKLNARMVTLIKGYATAYNAKQVTDAVASQMTTDYLAIERDRVALMQSYVPKFSAVLPATKVTRYYQIENKIRAVVNYELADAIPLVQ